MAKLRRLPNALNEFVSDGNFFDGDPALSGHATLEWYGSGATLRLHPETILADVKFVLGNKSVITVGAETQVIGEIRADSRSTVTVGSKTHFSRPCQIRASEGTTVAIGSHCLFSNVRIQSGDLHLIMDQATGERLNPSKDIVISDKVWLAEDVKIYKGVTIGRGSVVGAYSVVVKSIPGYSVAAGIPAKVTKSGIVWQRFLDPSKWVE